jgi:hypothetical protein
MLSELMDNYDEILPDLTEIGGLGLNWDNLFDCCNEDYPYPNFGIDDMYSIGSSGHDYLVFLPMPKLTVEQYPIALFNEESGTSRIIGSSIKTWFPCYLVSRVDQLLRIYAQSEDEEEKIQADEDLDALLADKVKIAKFAEEFPNKAFLKMLPALFEAVSKKSLSGWDNAAMHRAADGGSYIDDFNDLASAKMTAASVKAFIKKNPLCRSVFAALVSEDGSAPLLDKETALKIISSSVTSDLGSRDDIYRVLRAAATVLRTDEAYEESPFAGLVDELCDSEDPCIAHFYYEAGISLANDGDLPAALACYENAIFFSWAEEGSFHGEAFDEICYLAQEIGDKNYLSFIRSLRFEGALDEDAADADEDEEPGFPEEEAAADDEEEEDEDDEEDEEADDEDKKKPRKKSPPAKGKSRS